MKPLFCNLFKKITLPTVTPTVGTVAVWGANGQLASGTLTTANVVTGSGTLTAPNQGKVVVITAANQIGSGYAVDASSSNSSIALRDNAGGIAGTSFYTGAAEEDRVVIGSTSSIGFNSADEITWSILNATGEAQFSSISLPNASDDSKCELNTLEAKGYNYLGNLTWIISNNSGSADFGAAGGTRFQIDVASEYIVGINSDEVQTLRFSSTLGTGSFGVSGEEQVIILPTGVAGYDSAGDLTWQLDNETGLLTLGDSTVDHLKLNNNELRGYDGSDNLALSLNWTTATGYFGPIGQRRSIISNNGLSGLDDTNAIMWNINNEYGNGTFGLTTAQRVIASPSGLYGYSTTNALRFYWNSETGGFELYRTITTGGTTGAVTINKPAGTANIATAGTSVVVTNSTVTANSIILPVLRTNDTTAKIKNVVAGSGAFTINLEAAATGEVSIGWLVTN